MDNKSKKDRKAKNLEVFGTTTMTKATLLFFKTSTGNPDKEKVKEFGDLRKDGMTLFPTFKFFLYPAPTQIDIKLRTLRFENAHDVGKTEEPKPKQTSPDDALLALVPGWAITDLGGSVIVHFFA